MRTHEDTIGECTKRFHVDLKHELIMLTTGYAVSSFNCFCRTEGHVILAPAASRDCGFIRGVQGNHAHTDVSEVDALLANPILGDRLEEFGRTVLPRWGGTQDAVDTIVGGDVREFQ